MHLHIKIFIKPVTGASLQVHFLLLKITFTIKSGLVNELVN